MTANAAAAAITAAQQPAVDRIDAARLAQSIAVFERIRGGYDSQRCTLARMSRLLRPMRGSSSA